MIDLTEKEFKILVKMLVDKMKRMPDNSSLVELFDKCKEILKNWKD